MAVDFSRALKVKSPTKGVTTLYGLTTAPSGHYIAFRSQGAVRYIKLLKETILGSVSPLKVYIGGEVKEARTATGFVFTFENSTASMPWQTLYMCGLKTITNNDGGLSVDTTAIIEIRKGSNVLKTNTVTFNANTASQTYEVAVYFGSTLPDAIRITLTANGKSTSYLNGNYTQNGTQNVTPSLQIAPW